MTHEQSGEDRLERAVKLGGDEVVDESARHWCLQAIDDRTEPVSERRLPAALRDTVSSRGRCQAIEIFATCRGDLEPRQRLDEAFLGVMLPRAVGALWDVRLTGAAGSDPSGSRSPA